MAWGKQEAPHHSAEKQALEQTARREGSQSEALVSCKVIHVDQVTGPRGGCVWVRWLECGSVVWSRGKEPRSREVRHCMSCWVREHLKAPELSTD